MKLGTATCSSLFICALAAGTAQPADEKQQPRSDAKAPPALSYKVNDIDGNEADLARYKGSVLMLVNVASECGLTPQYEELEALYRKHKDAGFKILAFPANNFGAQEPGSNSKIKQFCTTQYHVTFDLFAKVSVKGEDQCPLYQYLTDKDKHKALGGPIRWNFTKFIVDRKGQVVARVEPRVCPSDARVAEVIEQALAAKKIKPQVISKK